MQALEYVQNFFYSLYLFYNYHFFTYQSFLCRFTELKHMEEDEAYLKDFGLSTPQFMHLDKLHEEA